MAVQLEVMTRLQRVEFVPLVLVVYDLLALIFAESEDEQALVLHGNEVEGKGDQETGNLGLPETEGLVTECEAPRSDVNDEDTVDVDVDALVADHQLPLHNVPLLVLVPLAVLPHLNVDVADIQLVLPVDHEHLFLVARTVESAILSERLELPDFQKIKT